MLLRVATGADTGRSVELAGGAVVVGRNPECDLVLADDAVAERHLHLKRLPTGAVVLNDLDLRRGAWVGDQRVECAVLRGGERVRIGETLLELVAEPARHQRGTRAAPAPAHSPSVLERIRLRRSVRRATALGAVAIAGVALVALAFVTGLIGGASEDARVEAVVQRVAPSTVLVQAQREAARSGSGTGWVLDAGAGMLVTNAHVINAGSRFTVGVGTTLRRARVVGASPCEDLAVLQLGDRRGLRTLPMASQATLRQGQTVVAVGFPGNASLSDDLTSTTGVVSVVRSQYREAALDVPEYPDVVQTDAAINPGNSGGPLVDLAGRLVGVNAAGRTVSAAGRIIQGQSYAIGVDRVRPVVSRLRAGRSEGWYGLGFRYLAGSDLRRRGLPIGLLVSSVVEGSPADRAGLAPGSMLLTSLGGTPVSNSLLSYCDAVDRLTPGRPVRLAGIDPRTGRRRSLVLPP